MTMKTQQALQGPLGFFILQRLFSALLTEGVYVELQDATRKAAKVQLLEHEVVPHRS